MPTRAPTTPPAVAPTAAPLRAAMMGPAAMKGPRPGIAKAPIPASQPNAPPRMPPVPAPVTAPSGAFVALRCANSLVLLVSGRSTEMSLLEKPAIFRSSTMRPACDSSLARQNTDFFDIQFSFDSNKLLLPGLVVRLVLFHLKLVVPGIYAGLLYD